MVKMQRQAEMPCPPSGATIEFVNQYNDNVLLLSQQFKSRLAEHVTLKSGIVGEAAAVERLAQTEALVSTTRHEDTPFVDITHDRRWLFATVRKWGTLIDKEDEIGRASCRERV
jgi:hypothetical protein